jgi:hypothetical protein
VNKKSAPCTLSMYTGGFNERCVNVFLLFIIIIFCSVDPFDVLQTWILIFFCILILSYSSQEGMNVKRSSQCFITDDDNVFMMINGVKYCTYLK